MAVGIATQPQTTRTIAATSQNWLMLGVSFWPLAGVFADAYAHTNTNIESFFNPWHALLYSGLLAYTLTLFYITWQNSHIGGISLRQAIPAGYELAFIGVAMLGVGGPGDLVWHTIFGFERDLAAIVSPTHLIIETGLVLIISAPARALLIRNRTTPITGWQQLPMVMSLAFTYTIISLYIQIVNPFSFHWASAGTKDLFKDNVPPVDQYLNNSLGLGGVIAFSLILSLVMLYVVRRIHLMPGAVTIILTLDVAALCAIQLNFGLLPAAIIAGILIDILIQAFRLPNPNIVLFRVFAFLLPFIVMALYFGLLFAEEGITWIIHFWLGSIFAAGIIGVGVSFLVAPSEELPVLTSDTPQ